MTSPHLADRQDMTRRTGEAWRPRAFTQPAKDAHRTAAAALRRFLDLQAGSGWRDLSLLLPACEGVVLDVGCGAQPYRGLLGPRAKYLGIDTSQARANFDYEVPDTLYFDGDRWPVEDASVDVVLCTETLEHVPATEAFLDEMGRVLRAGGTVILTVPFSARFHYIPHDYWRFTPTSLKMIFDQHGFGDVAVYARGNAVTVACYKAMALMLPLLFPTARSAFARLALRGLGLLLSPALVTLAGIANLSFFFGDGDDCLGYTLVARRLDEDGASGSNA
jgi:SAM-dependent methyltransferase